MDIEMNKMKNGFNEVIWEFHSTGDVMNDTLTNEIQYRIKATKYTLVVDDCSYVRHSPTYKPMRCGSLQLCDTLSKLQT
jgi:hypothetical protein